MIKAQETLELIKFLAYGRFEVDYEPIETALEALSIIVEKNVNIELIQNSKRATNYNAYQTSINKLTKKEFLQVKEVTGTCII